MRILFCADPWNASQVDPMYEGEQKAAEQAGFVTSLIQFEALLEQREARALRRVDVAKTPEAGIYRGWMLQPQQYQRLYTALLEKNITLINTPEAYQHCHYLPASYDLIKDVTPLTTWLPLTQDEHDVSLLIDEVMQKLWIFGTKPIIVKDFVKSRKHEWYEACYIPSAADREAVERVVGRFIELQGQELQEGLVFREFVTFEPLTQHSKSGMPLTREYRLFFLDGELSLAAPYWEEGEYKEETLPLDFFTSVAKRIQSRFFTMDVAKRTDGDWQVIELGDGQVAGLPASVRAEDFYQAWGDGRQGKPAAMARRIKRHDALP